MKFQSISSKTWCTFILSAVDLNPQEITSLMSITPDYFHSPSITDSGESINGHWQLNSTLPEELPLEEHIWDLLKRIAPVRKKMKDLIAIKEGTFYCSTELSDYGSGGFQLSGRSLKLIGDLGASIQIHPYTPRS